MMMMSAGSLCSFHSFARRSCLPSAHLGAEIRLHHALSPVPAPQLQWTAKEPSRLLRLRSSFVLLRCTMGRAGDDDEHTNSRAPARLMQTQRLLEEAESRSSVREGKVPKVALEHVNISFARSGGPGGQNVNKVNTKVDMRFNVMAANWLPERIRQKLIQMEKNRINSQGELVISSTKTRTQRGNVEDALLKLQELIDAAAYVPPPPSEDTKKKISRLAKIQNEKRLEAKKRVSFKKANRRNAGFD